MRQLANKLAPANWLGDEHIEDALPVVGWIPVDVISEDSVFRIRVIGDSAKQSPTVYIKIMGKVNRDDFSRLVRRQPGSAAICDGVIMEFGISDDYKKWLRPKSGH